jgi:NAD(P)-dependent dehydrogenase (short-subunit alcohol dehydrogenase family)
LIDSDIVQMNSNRELAGRVAIVTGAGRNIGREIARSLAVGGAAVTVNVRSNRDEADSVAREIILAGSEALAFVADVSDPPDGAEDGGRDSGTFRSYRYTCQ